MTDIITIKGLNVKCVIGTEKWGKIKAQPAVVDVKITTELIKVGMSDNLEDTIDYSSIGKKIIAFSETPNTTYTCLHQYTVKLTQLILNEVKASSSSPMNSVNVTVSLPSAYLHSKNICCSVTRTPSNQNEVFIPDQDIYTIDNLNVLALIGYNPCERVVKQELDISLTYKLKELNQSITYQQLPSTIINPKKVAGDVEKLIDASSFVTVEALTSAMAHLCLSSFPIANIKVHLEKPKAVAFGKAAVIDIERNSNDLDKLNSSLTSKFIEPALPATTLNTAYIAFGGNVGNVVENIEEALDSLKQNGCQVIKTSLLYETKPMYYVDQNNFINGACMIYTSLEPENLLDLLKKIEVEVGRKPSIRNGPRAIDLDILFYNDLIYNSERLQIPHLRIAERCFVLKPLNDIARNFIHPVLQRPIHELLETLLHEPSEKDNSVVRVMPIRHQIWHWDSKTFLMGILNSTPDSFSDGGKYNTLETGLAHAKEMVDNGVDIIDIGGMSTRPFSDEVSEEEELARVIPLVKAIRAEPWGQEIPISVDTYRAEVARQSVIAGADLINDVTGGEGDPDMFKVMASTRVPVCIMHMRGTPKTMQSYCEYKNGVVAEIEQVMADRIAQAELAGVRLWNVILDPGLGFSKDVQQNFELVKGVKQMVRPDSLLAHLPTLIGPSRKTFIGKTLNKTTPAERVWGTAAVCTALIEQNTSILRVHDFKEMKDIITLGDRIYRQ